MVTTVYFVRHAEPNYDNHDDLTRELTPKGLRDRKKATAFLMDKNIDMIVSSPFRRAVETIEEFALAKNLSITKIEGFRERRIDSDWIEDFNDFTRKQWSDFSYKLSDGESLFEVQKRNIESLNKLVAENEGKRIVVGSHGTALSTIINYYNPDFGYDDFNRIKKLMPWIVEFNFNGEKCVSINEYEMKRSE